MCENTTFLLRLKYNGYSISLRTRPNQLVWPRNTEAPHGVNMDWETYTDDEGYDARKQY